MTAFPNWPAPFRVCIYCTGSVSLEEALDHPNLKSFTNWSVHQGECTEKWSKLTMAQQQEYHEARRIRDENLRTARETAGQIDSTLNKAHMEWQTRFTV